MFSLRRNTFRVILMLAAITVASHTCLAKELQYAGQVPRDASVVGMSGAGFSGESVSLYTGQHTEVFKLFSLPVRGMNSIDIALSYSGNVAQQAKLTNREAQASWVGLGFSLGFESISCNHNFTADINDDRYFYSDGSGTSFEIIAAPRLVGSIVWPETWAASNGANWLFTRVQETVGGRPQVTGWIITKEDGTKYKYGDFATGYTERNATGYLLRWGGFVGNGSTAGDSLVPNLWAVSRIEAGSSSYVTYTYEQQLDKLQVDAFPDYQSTYQYTQAMYPKTIECAGGYSVEFVLETREDWEDFLLPGQYEFYQLKRLAAIVKKHNGSVIERAELTHDYLEPRQDLKKLILKKIAVVDGTGEVSLPPTVFDYNCTLSEPGYGSIIKMTYPSGGTKRINYSECSADDVETVLNFNDNLDYKDGSVPEHAVTRNTILTKYRLDGEWVDRFRIGRWNGYWDFRSMEDLTDSHTGIYENDFTIAAGDEYAVVYHQNTEKFITLEWRGGAWLRDTIAPGWSFNPSDEIVNITAGKDLFVACQLQREYDGDDWYYLFVSAYLYKKTPTGWQEHHLSTSGSWKPQFVRVRLANDLYAISVVDPNPENEERGLIFGKYVESDLGVGSIISGYTGYQPYLRYAVGLDYIAWRYEYDNYLHIWSSASGSWGLTNIQVGNIVSLAALENVIVFTTYGVEWPVFLCAHRESGGWQYDPVYHDTCTQGSNVIVASTASNKIVVKQPCESGTAYQLFEFNGLSWNSNYVFTNAGDSAYKFYLTDEICVGYSSSQDALGVKRNLGWGSWTQTVRLNEEIEVWTGDFNCIYGADAFIAGAKDMAMVWGNAETECTPIGYMYTWDEWTNKWDTTNLVDYVDDYDGTDAVTRYLYPYNGRSYIVTPSYGFHCFQQYDGQFVGKPDIATVSSIELSPSGDPAADDNVIYTYSFEGGILDEAVNTPRFAKSVQATPRKASDAAPDGYTAHLFYNDVPSGVDGFGDLDYMLDGSEYLSYSYRSSETEGLTTCLDTTINYYSVDKISGLGGGIYRPQIDSTHTRTDSLASDVSYYYEDYPPDPFFRPLGVRQLASTRTRLSTGGEYLVDSNSYAFWDNWEMYGANAISQVSEQIKFYERDNLDSIVAYAGTEFAEKNDLWRPVRSFTYGTLFPSLTEQIITSDTLPDGQSFDVFGNQVAALDVNGTAGGTIYDTSGTRVIAEISGAAPGDIVYESFEESNYQKIDDSTSFTGDYSYRVGGTGGDHWSERFKLDVPDGTKEELPYAFSFWATGNWRGSVYYLIWYTCQGTPDCGIYRGLYSFYPEVDTWHNYGGVFDLNMVRDSCVNPPYMTIDSLEVAIVRHMYYYPDDTTLACDALLDYVRFDDLRVYPVGAQMATRVYDPVTGLVTSKSGVDNIPVRHEYDEFKRPLATSDYQSQPLSRREYYLQETFGEYSASVEINYDTLGTVTDQFVVEEEQEINYHIGGSAWGLTDDVHDSPVTLTASAEDGVGGSSSEQITITHYQRVDYSLYAWSQCCAADGWAKVYKNGVVMDSAKTPPCENATCGPYERDDYFYADTGDVIKVQVFEECGATDPCPAEWEYRAEVDCVNRTVDEAEGYARVYKGSTLVDEVHLGEGIGSLHKENVFTVQADETVRVQVYVFSAYAGGQSWNFYAQAEGEAYVYDPDAPSYVKTTAYNAGTCDSTVSMTFYDGVGRAVQTRTLDSLNGAERAIVSGVAEYDARGQALKSYKTYRDLWGTTQMVDFSPFNTALSEVGQYYDADGPGVDCGGYPYSQNVYTQEVNAKLHKAASPGASWCVGSGRAVTFERYGNDDDEEYVVRTVDQDDLEAVRVADQWGEYERSYGVLNGDTITTITYKDKLGRDRAVFIDTLRGTTPIPLRRAEYDDLGNLVETWKVDYGTIRMIYDKAGNLRFMQNDKRLDEDNFVYFKYDDLGRKIEEGLMGDASVNFTQAKAYDLSFPDTAQGDDPEIRYHWYYDYYDKGDSVINSPGQLVRVEDGGPEAVKYYKEFYYYPEEHYDMTIVRLPGHDLSSFKAIRHDYNFDGSLQSLSVYPHWSTDPDDYRTFDYEYDRLGRLSTIVEDFGGGDSILHVEYEYNADGSVSRKTLGRAHLKIGPTWYDDLAAVIDYRYDPRGMLVGIDDPDSVLSTFSGGAEAGDHFGLTLDYTYDGAGYYNGRVKRLYASNSGDGSEILNDYEYTYNDLGWLTRADHLYDDSFDRDYRYNRLGNRDSLYTATDTIAYAYDADTGSSKLLWFTGMGDYGMKYDLLGNMIEDSSRSLYNIWYDYRNLIDSARMSSALGPDGIDWMLMKYDQTGQRLEKGHFKYFWTECETNPPGPPPQPDRSSELAGGQPGDTCVGSELVKTFYLYDNGVLLATFDRDDNVIDLYINSPTGLVASYHEDDPDQLYYYQTDQIGSPRVIMHSPGGQPDPEVAQYINYHPFGQVSQSYGSFDSPLKFTGKEQDSERDFEFYYFGARYMDARIGMFTSVDKAGQFAGGYLYGGNNPIMGTDPDGNCFFLGFAISAAFYAIRNDDWQWDKMLAYGLVGGVAATLGAMVEPYSAMAQSAVNSSINSMGGHLIDGAPLGVNFGAFSWNEGSGLSVANPFKGNLLQSAAAGSGWMATMKDVFKASYYLRTDKEGRAQEQALREQQGEAYDRGVYKKIDSHKQIDKIELNESIPGRNEFTHSELVQYNDEASELMTYRSAGAHYKILEPELENKMLVGFEAAEVHFNRVPSQGLGIYNRFPYVPGAISAGMHIAVDAGGELLFPMAVAIDFYEFAYWGRQYYVY